MGNHNSLVEVHTSLYLALYADEAERFGLSSTESRLEMRKIRKRVASEGLSFLTITLPKLGKAIDKALSTNTMLLVPGLQKRPGTMLPKLFGWALSKVFTDSGLERPDADPESLRILRQLVYFVYKLEIPYDVAKTQKVIDDFVRTDHELGELVVPTDNISKNARWFTTDVFGMFDPSAILPRHGPGSVATGEEPNEKHKFSRIYEPIERVYPFTEYFSFSIGQVADEYQTYEALEVLKTGTAKVVLVPKDSRGPRLISCEPLEYQWIQQGLGRKISSHLEAHKLTAGHVNFTDQTINRELALSASADQEWVTLDMKEASDRVSLALVRELFRDVPVLLEALEATRTTATTLPSGEVVQLNKFAPMGSCLCFPIEAFVFYALAVSVLMNDGHYSRREARKRVYVYGDDIIVRRKDFALLLQRFPSYGLMFNDGKCCTSGFFRESCGCDAYRGVDVTPIKLRSVWCHSRTMDIGVIASYVSLSNEAYKRGHKRLSLVAERLVLRRTGPLPIFREENHSGIGFVRPDVCTYVQPEGVKVRWNSEYQRREVRTWRSRSAYCYADPDDWSTVLRRFSAPDQYTNPGTYAWPRRSRPQRGWAVLPW